MSVSVRAGGKRLLAAATMMTILLAGLASSASAQLTGAKSIPGDYSTIAAAITDLNTQGVGAGGVTFNVAAGYTETIAAPLSITATGTAANPIVFVKSGVGANPLVTAYTGGTGTPGTASQDGIWRLVGADYVTINGFDLTDNPANATNPSTMEYGIALYKASATDGCQNNTIQNCTITLNRVNNAAGTGPSVDGSRCIEVTNAIPTAATTALTVTAATGSNSNNRFYANTCQNSNVGIALTGFADTTPFANADAGNDIGGASLATGNIVKNFGGGAATNPAAGIRCTAQYGVNISYNTVNNNDGAGVNHATTLRGIFNNTAVSASATITNNTVTVKSGATTSLLTAIDNVAGATAAGNTISINNNTIQNCSYSTATSGAFTGIVNSASAANVNINNNVLTGNATNATSGATNLIQNTGAVTVALNINGNNINGWTFNAVTSGTLNGINSTNTVTAALSISNNNFQAITHAVAGSSTHLYITYTNASSNTANINGNTFTNLNVNTTGSVTFMTRAGNMTATGVENCNNNSIVTAFNKGGAGGTVSFYGANASSVNGSSMTQTGNNFSNVTVTGATTIAGWSNTEGASSSSGPVKSITSNTFNNITGGTSAVTGMSVNFSGANSTVAQNTISNINSGAAITGLTLGSSNQATLAVTQNLIDPITSSGASAVTAISSAAATVNIAKNKIYDLSGTNAGSTVNGILVTAGTTVTVANNLIGNLTAPAASGADVIRGISSTSTTATSNLNVSFNTIYLNASSTGTNFGSSGVFHTTSATATTAALNLRNNIIVNASTPNGTGLTAAYRRSSTTLTNFGATSNNNLLYAGTPGASRVIFYDGTNSDQTLGGYKSRVSPRDAAAITENPPFLSTTGSSPNFLHIDPAVATQIESGAQPVAGISDDFDGNARNVTTPDIGADEGGFTLADLAGPAINYTPIGNSTSLTTVAFTGVAITDPSGVNGTPGTSPRVYYKKSTDPNNTFNDNTSGTTGWKYAESNGATSPFDFTIDYTRLSGGTVAVGDVIQYFVVAQDNAGTPNVGINNGTFAVQPTSVALTAAAFPIGGSIRTYNIVDVPLSGDYTVGTLLFNQVTGANLTFERQVRKVMREVLEPAAQAPQMSGDKASADVNLPEALEFKKVMREVEEVTWVPMQNGHKFEGDLYVKRSQNPALPASAQAGIYATITAAVNDLNLRGVSGPVRFLLTDPTYPSETLPITINVAGPAPSAANPVTIKPNLGVTTTVSGASASSAIFKVFGTNYITIDGSNTVGGTTRDMTIENTSVTTPNVVWFGSNGTTPITNGALKNCLVRNGVNTSSAVVISDGTTAGNAGFFSDMEVRNNKVEKAFIGVFAQGGTVPANGANLTYADNDLTASGANAIRLVGLYMQGVNGGTVSNNSVANIEGATDETDIGIWVASGSKNVTVSGNAISNINYTGTGAFGPIGLDVTPAAALANINVISNTVTNVSTSGSTSVRGIASPVTGSGDIVIQRNTVTGVTNSNSGTFGAYGIDIAAGNNHTLKNNMVSDVRFNMTGGAAFSTTFGVFGIRIASGTGHVIADNSVNMFGAMTGTAASSLLSAALCVVSSSSTGMDIRNNVLSNTLTGGTTSIAHVAAFLPSGATSSMNLTWNNNAYFTGTTAASQGLAQVGTTAGSGFYLAGDFAPGAITPANNFRAYTSTLSAAGTNDNVSFATTAAAPFLANTNLHINPALPTQIESGGSPVAGLTDDIDGDVRNVTTPDIGADEGSFTGLTTTDAGAQAFIDPTNGGSKGVGVSFAPQARFVNNGTAAVTNMPVRFRIVGPAPALTEIYNDTQVVPALGALGGTAVQAFTSLSIAAAGTYTMYAKAELPGDTIPANDEITGTFDVLAPLAGVYPIGAAQAAPFNTLTSAIAKLNQVGVSAAVTFSLTDSLYAAGETFPLTINAIQGGSATNTFTLKPATGVVAVIRGASASATLILNGADYVTIDGSNTPAGTTRDLTLQNTTAGSAVVWGQTAAADAVTNDSVKNCNILGGGSGAVTIGVGFGGTTIGIASNGTGNNDNSVLNCAVSRANYGIYSAGASAASPNTGTVIADNTMNAAAPANILKAGIFVRFDDGVQVRRNTVSLVSQSSGTAAGIALGVGPVTNVLTITAGDEVRNALVERNTIVNIASPSTTGFSALGIILGPAASGTNEVVSNVVAGVLSPSTPDDITAGIFAVAGVGATHIYFNSIAMAGSRGAASNPSYAVAIGGTDQLVDIRNNILYNTQTSTGAGRSYAIGLDYGTFANLTSDYNEFFTGGASDGFSITGLLDTGTEHTSLAAWQTATGQDAHSFVGDPLFTNVATDLHLSLAGPTVPPAYHAGVTIPGVTTDMDGQVRNNPPTIGADEIFDTVAPAVAVTSPNGGESFPDASVQNITWTATDLFGVTSVDIEYSINNGTSWLPIAAAVANSGTYAWNVPNTPTTQGLVRVTAHDAVPNSGQDVSDATFTITSTSGVGEGAIPMVTSVGVNYPNPFVRSTVIPYGIKADSHVRLDIFDISGRLVRTLVDQDERAGSRVLNWDGTDGDGARVASGVYMVRFIADGKVQTRSLRVVR